MRLFVTASLSAGAAVAATPGQAHRLGTVMRKSAGQQVRLFNGTDGEWLARIAGLARGAGSFAVESLVRPQAAEPGPVLAFAPLKREGTDLVAEKAVELGVSVLQPVLTDRTVAARVNLDRLKAIAVEAAEQCERLTLPDIRPPVPLPELLAAWPAAGLLAVAVERSAGKAPLLGPGPAGLLIGPEGGFTGAELDLLRRQPFVVEASLGPLVLRAETAAIAGLARLLAA